MAWPVSIPDSVSVPAQSALSAATRFDRMVSRSTPLDQIDAALQAGAKARAETLKAMKALRKVRQDAKREHAEAARQAAKYVRDEARLTRDREARVAGERMAAEMGVAA